MSDEWRVEVELGDEQHHLTLGERLRTLDLDDEARSRLGDRVIATRDGDHMFLYADTRPPPGRPSASRASSLPTKASPVRSR